MFRRLENRMINKINEKAEKSDCKSQMNYGSIEEKKLIFMSFVTKMSLANRIKAIFMA